MNLAYEIRLLGERMGVASLSLSPAGLLAFDVTGMGRVFLEARDENMLVYVAFPIAAHDEERMAQQALAACHFSKGHPLSVHAGLHKGSLIFLCALPVEQVTAAVLENTISYVANILQGVVAG